jgi:hypothetical protein
LGAVYGPRQLETITADSFVAMFLEERGCLWGEGWIDAKDFQHFEKSHKKRGFFKRNSACGMYARIYVVYCMRVRAYSFRF